MNKSLSASLSLSSRTRHNINTCFSLLLCVVELALLLGAKADPFEEKRSWQDTTTKIPLTRKKLILSRYPLYCPLGVDSDLIFSSVALSTLCTFGLFLPRIFPSASLDGINRLTQFSILKSIVFIVKYQ